MNLKDTSQIPKLSGIYKIVNIVNNKAYIGSSVNLKARLSKHYYELKTKTHNNKYLLKSFEKYGEDSFIIEFLHIYESIEYKELLDIEKNCILQYDTLNNGYNLILNNSEYFKELNKSESHISNNRNKTSRKVIAFNMFTGEQVKVFNSITEASLFFETSSSNISRVCKGSLNYIKDHTFCYFEDYDSSKDYSKSKSKKGLKLKESHIANLRISNQKRLGRKVYKYSIEWEFIEKYVSMSDAEFKNNLPKESLRRRLDSRTPFEGYYWLSTKKEDIV